MNTAPKSLHWILSLLVFSVPTLAFSAQVAKVKDKKVLLQLDGEPAEVGDFYYLLNSDGKKKGIVKITKVRDDKAIATLGKGEARPGWTLLKREKKAGAHTKSAGKVRHEKQAVGESYFGVSLGYSMDSMKVQLAPDTTVSLSGGAITYKGFFDYNLFDRVWFRGYAGVESFVANGPTVCGGAACDVNITYLSMDLWGRYVFMPGSFRPWLGGGFSLIFPLSKSSTALSESSISNTSIISFGGGFDYFFTPTIFVPLTVEYGLFPKSDNVDTNLIAIRTGLGFSF